MNKLLAFINGVRGFRTDFTAHYADYEVMRAYDWGREWAHRLTLRRFDY